MRGSNPKRPPETGDGTSLKVVKIFATLQGEGPFVGWPSIFVRLGGCNLACNFCDTQFENFTSLTLGDVLARIEALACEENRRVCDLVVITGGEPMRQNIIPLCEALIKKGFTVQIETNGTIFRALPDAVHVVCSPKAMDGTYYPLRPDMLARAQALKFLISANEKPYDTVPEVGQSGMDIPIYVQPMDVDNHEERQANIAHTLSLACTQGYRLSLQTHKLLGIP